MYDSFVQEYVKISEAVAQMPPENKQWLTPEQIARAKRFGVDALVGGAGFGLGYGAGAAAGRLLGEQYPGLGKNPWVRVGMGGLAAGTSLLGMYAGDLRRKYIDNSQPIDTRNRNRLPPGGQG